MRCLLLVLTLLCSPLFAVAEDSPSGKPPKGFTSLFNEKDLTGWKVHNGKIGSWSVDKGLLFVKGGGGGWLMTEKEYANFELRLEFKVPKGGNSGVALRAPMKGDPAYSGMEIQILDDRDPSYKGLQKWQATGSIYGVVAASKVPTKKVGEWNSYRIVCNGRKVTIELNGEKVVDADLDDHVEKHAKSHPGILRKSGHLGLQEHGGRVEFRNLYVKELP